MAKDRFFSRQKTIDKIRKKEYTNSNKQRRRCKHSAYSVFVFRNSDLL